MCDNDSDHWLFESFDFVIVCGITDILLFDICFFCPFPIPIPFSPLKCFILVILQIYVLHPSSRDVAIVQ